MGARRDDRIGPAADDHSHELAESGLLRRADLQDPAAEKAGKGTWENAPQLEKQFLTALGLDSSQYDLHDGSGLSPQNRVAAAQIVEFLRAMDRQPYGAAWKSSLAVGGDPGSTLRHRFREADLQGRIVAKTGSIAGVSTL